MDAALNDALWRLAEGGLSHLTREALARALERSTTEIQDQFPQDDHLLLRLLYDLQEQVGQLTFTPQDSPQDRLFETVMAYLDALEPRRAAVGRLWKDVWCAPLTLLFLRSHYQKMTETILGNCGIENGDLRSFIRTRAYGAFFLYSLHVWLGDETPDHSKTLAAVDQGLHRLGEWVS